MNVNNRENFLIFHIAHDDIEWFREILNILDSENSNPKFNERKNYWADSLAFDDDDDELCEINKKKFANRINWTLLRVRIADVTNKREIYLFIEIVAKKQENKIIFISSSRVAWQH